MRNSFTQNLTWFWQNAERILIVIFLATFTFNIRKVFLTPYSYLNGEFNEYLTLSFSWADLLMLAVILIYTTKLLYSQLKGREAKGLTPHNNNIEKSSNTGLLRSLHNVSRLPRNTIGYLCQLLKGAFSSLIVVWGETFWLALFLAWTFLSIFWSTYKPIAFYKIAGLFLVVIFALILIAKLKEKKWLKMAVFALILNGVFQSTLGITQFINNGSVGLRLIGESIVSQNLPGVAKIILAGGKHIRAYGTLPHQNILAGFLILPTFLIVSELVQRTALRTGGGKDVARETILEGAPTGFLLAALCFIAAGFVLALSRSAFLGLGIGFLLLFGLNFNLLGRTLRFSHLKERLLLLLVMLVMISFLVAFFLPAGKILFSSKSLSERNLYLDVSREIISEHPISGVGIGQFILSEYKNYSNLEGWHYQPVHNVYLLITSELGTVGLILLLLFILTILHNCCINTKRKNRNTGLLRMTDNLFCVIILAFIVISLFDHYFWDIKTGMIIFALAVIFSKIMGGIEKPNSAG